ncbi:MAG: peptidylprolyl isomerase [Calditrichae bacterium]|nr:peptidylprolyl isomerase [Calditrichota bacterium]MCB9058125.1 peptidylprolyl isomerase [Calditrichia bacterium]
MRLIVVFTLAILIINSCSTGPDSVATVGNLQVTADELKSQLSRRFPDKENYQDVAITEKNQMLDQLILRKLRLNEAYEQGIDKDNTIVNDYEKRKGQMLSNRYFEKVVIDNLFPETLIRSEFEKTKTEVKARHVLISFKSAPRSLNSRSEEEAKKLAEKIVTQARSGEKKLYQLALLYSDDSTVKQNQGDLGYITWGQMVDAFQEKAFSLPVGEISDPVLSEFGYHIIKVEDTRPNAKFNEEDYPNQVENIKRRLYRSKADTARTLWDNHMEKLKEEKNYTFKDENIKKFLEDNKKLKDAGQLNGDNITPEDRKLELLTWKNGALTVDELLTGYGDKIARFHSHLTDSSSLYTDAGRLGSHHMVVQAAEEEGIMAEKDIKEQLDNFMEYSLLRVIEKQEVRDKVSYTEDELKDYYTQHKEEFVIPEQIEIWEIYTTDKNMADKAYRLAKMGKDFQGLASSFSEDSYFAKKGGYIGYKSKTARAAVSKAAFEAGENKLIEPVKYRKGWAVVKTGKKSPQTYKSLEKSRSVIVTKIKQQKSRDREKEWELELRDKYKIDINEDLLKSL